MAGLSAYVRSSLAVSPADQYYRKPHIGERAVAKSGVVDLSPRSNTLVVYRTP
jgi:hypothetical protein